MNQDSKLQMIISVLIPLAIFVFAGFYGATLGFGGGDDAYSVYGIVDTITSWHYKPSRVWGYPGYEIPAAFIVKYFGLYVGNLYAFFWSCIYVYFSYLIIKDSRNFSFVFPAIVLSPLLLINNSILLDYTQEAGLFVIAVWLAMKYDSTKDFKLLYLLVPVIILDVLTRPDYVVFVGCLFLALTIKSRVDNKIRVKIFLLFLFAGMLTICIFYALNNGFDNFTKINYLLDSPFWRRPPRAFFGLVIILTPIGFLATAYILYTKRTDLALVCKNFDGQTLLTRLFVFSIFFGLGRYFLQPDKLEFIFWEFTIFLYVISFAQIKKILVVLVVIPIIISPFLTIALFERDFVSYELRFSPTLQYGAFVQKSEKRRWNSYREKTDFDKIVIESARRDFPECKSLTFDQMAKDDDCLITDKWTMHQVLGLTATSGSKAAKFDHVLISDLPVDGWRGFRVSQPWESFDKTIQYFENYKKLPLKKFEARLK